MWILHIDGSSTKRGSGAGLVLTSPHGVKISYALKFGFEASNNEAKYEALIAGIQLTKDIGVEKLEVFSDSMLVIQQLNGQYEAKGEGMIQYLQLMRSMISEFLY